MWDGPLYRVKRDGDETCCVPSDGEDLDKVCTVDMWVTRDDGDRCCGTHYWWCWDGLIVRDAGVPSMVEVVDGLVAAGRLETVLRHIGPKRTSSTGSARSAQ
jgi:hypothetical protein